jgi:epoxide hydrolase-like predicted phosphatase
MPIAAIIVDFGGVLYFTPDMKWARRWQGWLGLKKNPLISAIIDSPEDSEFVGKIMVGEIPEAQVWQMMADQFKVHPVLVKFFRRSLISSRRLNREMMAFVNSLRPKYKTAILSNAGSDARSMFSDVFGFHRLVDEMIISAEERVAKPNQRIYQIAVERLGVQPEEAIFVDDLLPNVMAAHSFGLHAIHFKTTEQAMSEIQELLR